MRLTTALVLTLLATAHAADDLAQKLPRVPPTLPADVQKTFQVRDGFQMQLIAAEPLVNDPIAMVYDEDGRAYVVEMSDYPYTDKARHKPFADNTTDLPIGKIRLLEDTDGDGVFDRSTVFARDLSWPTGIAVWNGGVFVLATPDVWYLKDTDGDGVADVRIKIYTGFRKFNIQAVINNLQWGLDHKLYAAGGTNGGDVRRLDRPDAPPVHFTRNDFRFDPITHDFELLSGGARYGNTFDAWANRFICNIRNPLMHVVLPSRYLARNPFVPVHNVIHDAAEGGDNIPVYPISTDEPWRALRAERWRRENRPTPNSELNGGFFTSTSGVTIYLGDAYGPPYLGNMFVGEVAGNLVHREIVEPDGVSFRAHRAPGEEKSEFVRSTDNWFRPVNFVNAPDGTLHVCDMYRETIEHPWSLPDDIHAALDLESGRDRGRIYRLAPPGFKPRPKPHLSTATTDQLVATLEHPASWWRDTAQRLLFERQDRAAAPPLKKLLRDSKQPLARLHALYALDGLQSLDEADLLTALSDSVPGVREHAVKLSEPRLKTSPKLVAAIARPTPDPDIRVRFQTAFTLGELGPEATDALAAIARLDAADEWVRSAVLSSAAPRAHTLITRLIADRTWAHRAESAELLRSLAFIVGARHKPDELRTALQALVDTDGSPALITGLADGLKRAGHSLRKAAADHPASAIIDAALTRAASTAADPAASPADRVAAIALMGQDANFTGLTPLLTAAQPEVQSAAARTLASSSSPQALSALLDAWPSFTPAMRTEVVEGLLSRKSNIPALLDAVEAGRISPAQISPARRAMLANSPDKSIAEKANRLFTQSAPSARAAVVAQYQSAITSLKADGQRGHAVYQRVCSVCHRLGNEGNDIGPNLATIQNRTPEELVLHILDPNREVAPQFVQYLLELTDGRTALGLIAAESATSLTLKRADGSTETILRTNIKKTTSLNLSLMPDGLESALTPQDMADLIAHLLARK